MMAVRIAFAVLVAGSHPAFAERIEHAVARKLSA